MNNHFKLKFAIAIYLLFVFLLLFLKPNFIFNEDGELKAFGTNENKTIIPLWLIFGLFGIISYYITLVIF